MFNEMNKQVTQFQYEPKNKEKFLSTAEYSKSNDNSENISVKDDSGKDIEIYPVHGYFFFNTIYGDSGACIMQDCNLYIPKHLLPIFKDMGENEVKAINEGHLGISLYSYDSKQRKNCTGIKFHDI